MSTATAIGYIIGFDLLPSIIDRTNPDRIQIFEKEKKLIAKGYNFGELNTILRPVNDDDINKMKIFYPQMVIDGNFPIPRVENFVFEGSARAEFNFFSIITALRILKEGDVRLSHTYLHRDQPLLTQNYLPSSPADARGAMYNLYYNELDSIKKIALNIHKYQERNNTESKKNQIALSWFNKSYDEHFGRLNTNILIELVICSEALFVDDKSYRHTGSIIGTACSMFIGKDKTEREKIKKAFEHAYTIRNKEVHGGDISRVNDVIFQKRVRHLADFNSEIYSYLRRSMLKLFL